MKFELPGISVDTLLIAAARVVSLFAACRSLADARTIKPIRNALAATCPKCASWSVA